MRSALRPRASSPQLQAHSVPEKQLMPAGQLPPPEQSRMHSLAPSPVTSVQVTGAVPPGEPGHAAALAHDSL